MNPATLIHNLATVKERIAAAARRSGRDAAAITLVAVTKRTPAEWARVLVELGVIDCGENYPQDLWSKADALRELPIRWHLIGHLQGNKAKKTLPLTRMVHAVDSLRLLRTLDELSGELAEPPTVCLQVNISGEPSKHGWSPDAVAADAEAIMGCRQIPIVGLMTIAALGTTAETARPAFERLRAIQDDLRARTGLPLKHLSMGMSNDYVTAVEEGATLVRVGSALFEGVGP